MPNWCENRVRLSDNGDNSEQFDKLVKLLDGPDPFNSIFPRPDFTKIPNDKGELPIAEEIKNSNGEVVTITYNFPDGKNDDRWYHWNIQNWGTKWDITTQNVEIEYEDDEQLEMSFETAWAPPEPICYRLREMFKDLNFSWFYDEPGMETAGYL